MPLRPVRKSLVATVASYDLEQVWKRPHGPTTIAVPPWLMSKIRTDYNYYSTIAIMGIKLNAQVIIKNLQNMHEKSLPPTGARKRMELEYQDWARLQGRGPHTGGRRGNDRSHRSRATTLQIGSGKA